VHFDDSVSGGEIPVGGAFDEAELQVARGMKNIVKSNQCYVERT
jgi:hypothetical protein